MCEGEASGGKGEECCKNHIEYWKFVIEILLSFLAWRSVMFEWLVWVSMMIIVGGRPGDLYFRGKTPLLL